MSVPADQSARERIQQDLDTSFLVEAAAGTGKTTQLVGRLLGVLRSGRAELKQVVAVTFTEKAAGEMKLRLRAEIERARHHPETTDDERARLVKALGQLEEARIGTIHSLCSDLLHERPVEARVDPLFEVMPAGEAQRLFEEAFGAWFAQVIQDPPEGVRRILRRRPRSSSGPGPADILSSTGWRLVDQRDFDGVWERDPSFDREAQIDELLDELGTVADYALRASKPNDKLLMNLNDIRQVTDEIRRKEEARPDAPRDYDGIEADLRRLASAWSWRRRGWGKMFGDGIPRQDVLSRRDAVKISLDAFLEKSDADVAALLHGELRSLIAAYEALKEKSGKLDFLDLLLLARNLVRDHDEVRADFQQRFQCVFIDEFQDTDPLQAEILILLAADDPAESDWTKVRPAPGKLFIVGDPKQSIYRFRRADIALYESIKERLLTQGVERLDLSTSFRAVPQIQQAVNAAFGRCMQGQRTGEQATQAGYVALQEFREAHDAQPAVVALPVPEPYDNWGNIRNYKIDDSLPDAVGAFVDWLIRESGWTVHDRENDTRVPLQARHVCLLFRRFRSYNKDVTRGYRRGLEARRIPHVLVGGRSFHEREEILAIRNALMAIEWPDDEFAVFATLRGPFFAVQDDALLEFRATVGALHPLRSVDEDALTPATAEVAEALAVLGELHRKRNRFPVADTIARLLEATRAHASLAIWPSGEQALANALRLVDVARQFEASGATSFRSFVERLIADADKGQASEAPVIEEGTDGVRVMTVHQAKGLEFPVVILCDPTASKVRRTPSRYVDTANKIWAEPIAGGCAPPVLLEHREEALTADEHEAERLAYVAATRARDLLVVPVVGDEKTSGWVDVLNPAVYPPDGCWRDSTTAFDLDLGEDSVLQRPMKAERSPADAVRPGLHTMNAGHRVFWWDPARLKLGVQLDGGLRQDKLLQADEGETVADAGLKSHDEWVARREAALATGSKVSQPARSVTALAEAAAEAAEPGPGDIELEHTDVERDRRPHGKRFGTLVHAVLSLVPLDAGRIAIGQLAAAQARLIGAPEAEVESAVAAVEAALAHPLMERAREADACRREIPVVVRQDDGLIAEGIVDLAFLEGDLWTVVDFKTDVDPTERESAYRTQVRIYTEGIARATGQKTRGALLWV